MAQTLCWLCKQGSCGRVHCLCNEDGVSNLVDWSSPEGEQTPYWILLSIVWVSDLYLVMPCICPEIVLAYTLVTPSPFNKARLRHACLLALHDIGDMYDTMVQLT